MGQQTFGDLLKDINIQTKDAIFTLLEEIPAKEIEQIEKQLSEPAFVFYIAANTIGGYKSDGWQSVIEENQSFLPYISNAMYEIELPEVGEATKDIVSFLLSFVNILTIDEKDFTELINFLRGVEEGKFGFKITIDELKRFSKEEREKITEEYFSKLEKLDELVEKIWDYGCPNNEGWDFISHYIEKHLQDNFRR